ncbi:MAG: 3',5'-cyclic-AMP phosphodiesterase [Halioglobus sp.]
MEISPITTADSKVHTLEHAGGVVKLLQITDCHLGEHSGASLLGVDTDRSLALVIEQAMRECGPPDAALLTGDLSDHGFTSAYVRMQDYSQQLGPQCFWLPGNHDNREGMNTVLAGTAALSPEIRIGNWQILMLDTQVPGEVGGELGAEQLRFLKDALEVASAERLHTLVCLHHHPIEIGCAWLDEQIVSDADAFFEVLDAHTCVKGVLWGHVHQQIDKTRNGVALMGSPSTCVQFAPGSDKFKADDSAPGYRWLELKPDGSVTTQVSRVEGVEFNVDLDSTGYL